MANKGNDLGFVKIWRPPVPPTRGPASVMAGPAVRRLLTTPPVRSAPDLIGLSMRRCLPRIVILRPTPPLGLRPATAWGTYLLTIGRSMMSLMQLLLDRGRTVSPRGRAGSLRPGTFPIVVGLVS